MVTRRQPTSDADAATADLGSLEPRATATIDAAQLARGRVDSLLVVSATVLPCGAADYPPLLLDLPRPPRLSVLGRLPGAPAVAIVGTRRAAAGACAFARRLAADLARRGLSVWSGGAVGIDAAAHAGALDAGGATVVVCGGGLERLYPPAHAALFDAVVAGGGALASLFAASEPPSPPRFHARNAVLAAATLVTIVVQAPLKSGARSTARQARRLGRLVGVVAHPPWDPLGAGCFDELSLGARVVCDADDVVALVEHARAARARRAMVAPAAPPDSRHGEPAQAVLDASTRRQPRSDGSKAESGSIRAARAVLAALETKSLCVDELCDATCLTAPAVAEALLTLTLQTVVVEGPAGLWRRKPET